MGTRIEVGEWHSDAPARYGPQEAYTQAFATVCGNVIVLRVCVSRLQCALCGPDFDWEDDIYDTRISYRSIDELPYAPQGSLWRSGWSDDRGARNRLAVHRDVAILVGLEFEHLAALRSGDCELFCHYSKGRDNIRSKER